MNAELVVEDDRKHDGFIDIKCPTLQSMADLERLSVTVHLQEVVNWGFDNWQEIRNFNLVFYQAGHVRLQIPNGNYEARFNRVEIEVTLGRLPNGEFNKTLNMARWLYWLENGGGMMILIIGPVLFITSATLKNNFDPRFAIVGIIFFFLGMGVRFVSTEFHTLRRGLKLKREGKF